MPKIERQAARRIAERKVAEVATQAGIELALSGAKVIEFDGGWIFPWNSKAYQQTGEFSDALAGNSPFVVFKDGSVSQAPSSCLTPADILEWVRANTDTERSRAEDSG